MSNTSELSKEAHDLLLRHSRSDRLDGEASSTQELQRAGFIVATSGDVMEGHYFPYAKTSAGIAYVSRYRKKKKQHDI